MASAMIVSLDRVIADLMSLAICLRPQCSFLYVFPLFSYD